MLPRTNNERTNNKQLLNYRAFQIFLLDLLDFLKSGDQQLKFSNGVSKAHIEVCLLWREGRSLLCILPAFELSEHCLLSVIGVSERAVSESSDELESSGRAPNCQDSMGKKCRGRLIEHNVLLQYVSTYREQLCFTKCLNRRWLVPYLTDPV